MVAVTSVAPFAPRLGKVRDWYANLVSAGAAVPLFLVTWSAIVILPLLVVVFFSFLQIRSYRVVYEPTLATWASLIDSGRWVAALRTLRVAFSITAIEFLLAFPFALWLAKGCRSKTAKSVIITLLTIPFFIDASSRIIVWRAILGEHGIINLVLTRLGIIDHSLNWLLFSEFAVHFGMIGPYFPTMVFPIYLVLTLIDDEFLEASGDLGASPLQTLLYVVLPLALPGIVAGVLFTLVPLMAAFVEPQMLGGGFVNLLGDSVDSALRELKYPTAAALSTVVIALLALLLTLLVVISRRRVDLATVFQMLRR
jgi:ABC-type spermidine/putrescine transport system permease subunit I